MKKFIYTLLLLCVFTYSKAGDNKTVTLITSGQGKTQDEAKQSALRNAIEQAFGAFISSHTEVVNDDLVKDEIISVSNGNIQKYEIISEAELPDNGGYTNTLKVIVSISKLTSFCESKGMQIEIKGSLFAFNVIQKELSASNEAKALQELVLIAKNIAPKLFDYNLQANEPFKNEIGSYSLPIKITIKANKNWAVLFDIISTTLNSLALPPQELDDYAKLNIKINTIKLLTTKHSLSGNYRYFTEQTRLSTSEINQATYDKNSLIIMTNVGKQKYEIWGLFAAEKKFIPSNYNYKILNFRNNILNYLISIQKIVQKEEDAWVLKSTNNTLIEGGSTSILHSTSLNIIGLPSDYYDNTGPQINKKVGSIDLIGFAKLGPVELQDKNFFVHNVEPDAIIGFSYANLLLSLDQIKNLSKLEVKHKD